MTWWQQSFWRDSEALYRRAIAVDPRSANAEGYLGYTLHEANNLAEPERHARRALEIDPSNHWGRLTLAHVHALAGRRDEAVKHREEALRLRPGFPGLRERIQRLRP